MTCESCKGTRRITLAYSVVECLDCAKPASLPASPMAKVRELVASGRLMVHDHAFQAGDRVRHVECGPSTILAIESPTGKPGWYWIQCDRKGTKGYAHESNMKKEDTI
jgi:hypothetical protein